ncbi:MULTISPECIES: AraC family transcriptional regulator [Enterobacterales]|uniref:helix-turn-helix transcriptional regulator n=1 Tax=Enterobacterales TaxID=91347 RepID=UPI002ED98D36
MQSTHQLHSLQQFIEMAQKWGYDYEVDTPSATATPAGRLPQFSGTVKAATLPYGVNLCLNDISVHSDDHRCGVLDHCMTILLVLDGDLPHYQLEGDAPLQLEKGVAKVIVAKEKWKLWCRNPGGHRCRSLVIQASPEQITERALASKVRSILHQCGVYEFPVSGHIIDRANELFSFCENCVTGRLQTHSCVLDILAQSIRVVEQQIPAGDTLAPVRNSERILRIRDKLISELDNSHCLCDLAREAGISVSTLKSKFQIVVGQSVFTFLREQRLLRARQGLESEGWSVKQAAYYVGYQHPSNFSTAYRRKFGRSPREYLNG